MLLFRSKRKKKRSLNDYQERVAGRMASALLAAQRRSAAWLNARALKLGRRYTLILIFVLGLGFGLWCLWLVISVLL